MSKENPRLNGRHVTEMSDGELRRHLEGTIPEWVEKAIKRELRERRWAAVKGFTE